MARGVDTEISHCPYRISLRSIHLQEKLYRGAAEEIRRGLFESQRRLEQSIRESESIGELDLPRTAGSAVGEAVSEMEQGAKRSSVWGSNGWLKLPQRAIELARDLQHAEAVATEQFGMQPSKGRAEYEGDAKNQRDRLQSVVGQRLELAFGIAALRPMFTGVQEAMLESPVLGEIAPGIVFQPPAIMSELPHQPDGEAFRF